MTFAGRTAAIAAVIGLASTIVSCDGGNPPSAGPTSSVHCPNPNGILSVGERLPVACSFERLDGGVFRVSDLAGKPAVLNFWASWCTWCIAEMPDIQKVYESFRGRVSFLGVDLLGVEAETKEAAMTFARSTRVTYPLVYDKGAVFFGYFGGARHTLPVTIIVRADGVIADRRFGPLTERQLRDLLKTDVGVQ